MKPTGNPVVHFSKTPSNGGYRIRTVASCQQESSTSPVAVLHWRCSILPAYIVFGVAALTKTSDPSASPSALSASAPVPFWRCDARSAKPRLSELAVGSGLMKLEQEQCGNGARDGPYKGLQG